MNVLITGGTGFIGRTLVPFLQARQHRITILTRRPQKISDPNVTGLSNLRELGDDTAVDAVINLAGAPIAKRWTPSYRQTLIDSRIATTEQVIALITRLKRKPRVLISASAIGYYGAQDNRPLSETAQPHPEFTHTLCEQWEQSAMQAESCGVRVCILRIGVVLGRGGGALQRMLPAFRLGLGGRMGDGRQMLSWVHIHDVVRACDFLLNGDALSGTFNLTAPHAVSNQAFSAALGRALRRPSYLPMPGLAVKMLFGEMGETLLLKGQNVVPERLQQAGFSFDYPLLEDALKEVVGGR